VERSSGTLIGSSLATIQKSAAPEVCFRDYLTKNTMSAISSSNLLILLSFSVQMLLALMDEAYTGSAIEDQSGNSGSDDSGPLDLADPMFLDLLKDENDGIAVSSSSFALCCCLFSPSFPIFLVIILYFVVVSL
jgi:AP-5 complex subunit zeta-1